jgi:hypothetical protein
MGIFPKFIEEHVLKQKDIDKLMGQKVCIPVGGAKPNSNCEFEDLQLVGHHIQAFFHQCCCIAVYGRRQALEETVPLKDRVKLLKGAALSQRNHAAGQVRLRRRVTRQ